MKIVTFRRNAETAPEVGILREDTVVSLGANCPTPTALIENWDMARGPITDYLGKAPAEAILPLSKVTIGAPVPKPAKLLCIGLNYRDHAIESKMEIPTIPVVFNKFANAIIGPNDPIVLPKASEKPDYEAELAFVIGEGGRYIKAKDWKKHVFGYTIINDVSARDFQLRTSQWMIGKAFDTFCPMGPWIVTSDEIEDPHELDIRMTVSGEVLQDSNTRELIFRIPELVEYLSSVMTLQAGDVVATGTPKGVGLGYNPPRWLKPGDECVIYIQGIGELRNPVVGEAEAAQA
ncbi:MAG TPA: fumarylacetoacetate hydrolase family protein [Bryobacteraceae bacterium]|nr:fumarylacetoacetate hydrolase family protein [Bryobacteraceae bacterium]